MLLDASFAIPTKSASAMTALLRSIYIPSQLLASAAVTPAFPALLPIVACNAFLAISSLSHLSVSCSVSLLVPLAQRIMLVIATPA